MDAARGRGTWVSLCASVSSYATAAPRAVRRERAPAPRKRTQCAAEALPCAPLAPNTAPGAEARFMVLCSLEASRTPCLANFRTCICALRLSRQPPASCATAAMLAAGAWCCFGGCMSSAAAHCTARGDVLAASAAHAEAPAAVCALRGAAVVVPGRTYHIWRYRLILLAATSVRYSSHRTRTSRGAMPGFYAMPVPAGPSDAWLQLCGRGGAAEERVRGGCGWSSHAAQHTAAPTHQLPPRMRCLDARHAADCTRCV